MARLQILELPEGTGDDRPPFVLVVDQITEDEGEAFFQSQEATNGFAAKVGARAVVAFHKVTIDLPANEAVPVDPVEGDAQTGELIHAHEQTRLALCDALLLSRDTTWHQLIKQVGERQRELAGLYRKADEQPHAQLHAEARAELTRSENARDALREQLGEARSWARHGYEIGQKHCSWSDHGVAPQWLTEGWPPHIDSCEHLKVAAEFDEALARVRGLPEQPEIMDSQHPHPHEYLRGYSHAINAAKRAARNDRAQAAENGG
ncbi:hypothetical protein [Streptomyces stelliscabiei]|uniref:hypothetical protein n=1 Tax=Streptomyces stelliscabiei TaxID=146820 RepID=UPI0029A2F2EE|nr:hypothetical protein [Streptomyces stelliscabiei]MDX2550099.1 hypothetical protein [Streptomyces stelliscabiei]